jgi:hypothetical protein
VDEAQWLGSTSGASTRWGFDTRMSSSGTQDGALDGEGMAVAIVEASGAMKKKMRKRGVLCSDRSHRKKLWGWDGSRGRSATWCKGEVVRWA